MGLFGTDGVRGIANQELTITLATKIGIAMGSVLPAASSVVIGRDTRVSGPMLESALAAGLAAMGIDVILVGVVPTPTLGFLIGHLHAEAGIMISASHNPPEYNGIKLLTNRGTKWETQDEVWVEKVVQGDIHPDMNPSRIGAIHHREDVAVEAYRRHLISMVMGDLPPGLRVVVDLAHGAAIATATSVLARLGVDVYSMYSEPDGRLINKNCGATHPEVLKQAVLDKQADLGLSFDGDADRVIAVDHEGRIVDGDEILYVLATGMKLRGELPDNKVVATVMSNLGTERALQAHGIELLRSTVGDRWVWELMQKTGALLGGEQSGHIIIRKWAQTGDGLLTGLMLLSELQRQQKPLAELVRPVQRYPQILRNVHLPQRIANWETMPGFTELVAEAESALGTEGRVLVRLSGTEPLLRIMIEGKNYEVINRWAEKLSNHAAQSLALRA